MKLLFAFGTRPETIKMAPVIKMAQSRGHQVFVALSGQHKEMVLPFIEWFDLKIDHDLEIMQPNQTLTDITVSALKGYSDLILKEKPDVVLVQGDTTTGFVASLAAFYQGVKVAHIEAGLRTHNKSSPFPEEINRSLIGRIADFHFPPTQTSAENLKLEAINKNVVITGNTSIDALKFTLEKISNDKEMILNIEKKLPQTCGRMILVTTHRRENLGDGHRSIFLAMKQLLEQHQDIEFVFPVHLNPKVRKIVDEELSDNSRVHLIEPLDYTSFVWAMKKSFLILTDSGGVQEEAPHLGRPVVVLRDTTERPEAISAGCSFMVGTNQEKIVEISNRLLNDSKYYDSVSKINNPYGDGNSSIKILESLESLN